MRKLYYDEIVTQLCKMYGVRSETEHEFIQEFYEGPLPIFKLMLTEDEESKESITIVSFHIEVEAAMAIQWFLRIREFEPNLHITTCYLKDAEGVSYVGEDAHVLRIYMVEQDVLGEYMASNKEIEDVVNPRTAIPKPSPIKTYWDYKAAVHAFIKLERKKTDTTH